MHIAATCLTKGPGTTESIESASMGLAGDRQDHAGMIYSRCGRGRGEGGSPEVAPVEGDDGRARTSTVGRHGSGRNRLGRRGRGGAGDGHGDQHGAQGAGRGSKRRSHRGRRQSPAQRGRAARLRGRTSRRLAEVGEARRSGHPRRSGVAGSAGHARARTRSPTRCSLGTASASAIRPSRNC
jgi:hypothetical protein